MNKIRLPLLASLVLVLSACGGKAPGDTITDMHAELCRTGDPATMSNYVSKKSQPAMAMITAMMAEPEKAKHRVAFDNLRRFAGGAGALCLPCGVG